MNINVVLCVALITMGVIAFAITKLGTSFFDAVSRNPVAGEQMRGMLLVLASMTELLGLVMMAVALYITFVK